MTRYLLTATAITLALSGSAFIPQLSRAEDTIFFCGLHDGAPATLARTLQGEVPIVLWTAHDLANSEMTPQERCEEGSKRFQAHHDNGTLSQITTGKVDEQLVVCGAEREGEGCSGVLFKLKPGSEPRSALQRIFRIRVPVDSPITEPPPRVYIDLARYLDGGYPR